MAGKSTPRVPPQKPQADPLADLRGGTEGPDLAPLPTLPPSADGTDLPDDGSEAEGIDVRPMVSPDLWDEMVAEVVAAWHADPTSQGFLHGGGQCGCLYIARAGLRAAVPVSVLVLDTEVIDLEPADG